MPAFRAAETSSPARSWARRSPSWNGPLASRSEREDGIALGRERSEARDAGGVGESVVLHELEARAPCVRRGPEDLRAPAGDARDLVGDREVETASGMRRLVELSRPARA